MLRQMNSNFLTNERIRNWWSVRTKSNSTMDELKHIPKLAKGHLSSLWLKIRKFGKTDNNGPETIGNYKKRGNIAEITGNSKTTMHIEDVNMENSLENIEFRQSNSYEVLERYPENSGKSSNCRNGVQIVENEWRNQEVFPFSNKRLIIVYSHLSQLPVKMNKC